MSSNNGNLNKDKFLGMPHGTAQGRLRKLILFDLLKRHGENICYRCSKSIETVEDLSIEHKKAWLGIDVKLFWDLSNIAFSHLKCNVGSGRHPNKGNITHGATGYTYHNCRCDVCRKAQKERQAIRRSDGKR